MLKMDVMLLLQSTYYTKFHTLVRMCSLMSYSVIILAIEEFRIFGTNGNKDSLTLPTIQWTSLLNLGLILIKSPY